MFAYFAQPAIPVVDSAKRFMLNLQHAGSEMYLLGVFGLAGTCSCLVRCAQVRGLPHTSAGVEASLKAGGRFTAVLALETRAHDQAW